MLAVLDCTTVKDSVSAYVQETLSKSEVNAIDAHLAECDSCRFLIDQSIVAACFAPSEPTARTSRADDPSTSTVIAAIPVNVRSAPPHPRAPVATPEAKPLPPPSVIPTLVPVPKELVPPIELPSVAAADTALAPPTPVAPPPAAAPHFSKSLRTTIFSLPWWAVSAAFHVLVIALIGLISMTIRPADTDDNVVLIAPLCRPSAVHVEVERHADATAMLSKLDTPPTDPNSKLRADVTVPPDVLANAELSDHFETLNLENSDRASAFGNPDAHVFQALRGDDSAAGGGGESGADFQALIGAGGGTTRGSGGGFGGGSGSGVGTDFGSGSGCFGQRSGSGHALLVKRHGGSPATEAAVDRALYWLARHQSADGHWDISKIDAGNNMSAGGVHDECVASLAVLAFLGAGHSPKAGKYRDTVTRGIDWIIKRQAPDGRIKPPEPVVPAGVPGQPVKFPTGAMSYLKGHPYNYPESLVTLALCEAYGMTNDKRIGEAAQRGVDFIVAQQEFDGGWSHFTCKSTSVVGWMVMALKSAKIANLRVPPQTFANAVKYLKGVCEKQSDGYYGLAGYSRLKEYYYNKGHTMTAVAMVCFQFLGYGSDTHAQAEILIKNPPEWTPHDDNQGLPQNFYHWYYGTIAMFQVGGDKWKIWNEAMQKALLPNQHKELTVATDGSPKDIDGSWDPVTTWDSTCGRVYSTAMGALCLEVYYRYLQVSSHK